MSKKSRLKHTQKKKHAKKLTNLTRRQAQMSLELAEAREKLQREVPLMDRLMADVRTFMRHVLSMEAKLKSTVAFIETGAYIDNPLMTRDEYIMALNAEIKKIQNYRSTTLNPLIQKMVETYELKNNADRLLGEVEMQVALEEACNIFTATAEDIHDNTEKLNLQESLQIKPSTLIMGTAATDAPTVAEIKTDSETTETAVADVTASPQEV